MAEMSMHSDFICTPVQEGLSLRILSVCRNCGASRVVSVSDGSLDEWQGEHECGAERRPPQREIVPRKRANEG